MNAPICSATLDVLRFPCTPDVCPDAAVRAAVDVLGGCGVAVGVCATTVSPRGVLLDDGGRVTLDGGLGGAGVDGIGGVGPGDHCPTRPFMNASSNASYRRSEPMAGYSHA